MHDSLGGMHGSLVLIHGLASAGRSWDAFERELSPGAEVVALDLPGHAHTPAEHPYSFGAVAAFVASRCAGLPAPLTLLGHSLGGAVALLVGSGLFGVRASRVIALDTKVGWSEGELERASAVAAKPPKVFGTREETLVFWQRVAGMPVGAPVDQLLQDAVLEHRPDGRWQLAYDPRAAGLGAAPVEQLIALCEAPVQLVRGADDPLVGDDDVSLPGALPPVVVPGCGHSPHLERPAELAALLGLSPSLTREEEYVL